MDLLSAGPERVRPPRRRWVAGVVAVVVAATAVVLAARAAPGRQDATPTPTPTVAPRQPLSAVVAVAVGRRWAYALLARCDTRTSCGWDLHRREVSGSGWFPTALRTTVRESGGLVPLLYADGDAVTVVDQPETGVVWHSPDGGTSVQARRLESVDAVDSVPAGGVVDTELCASCAYRLAVLNPLDGTLRLLRAQPPIGRYGVQVSSAGPTIWVASTGARGEVVPAVSPDSGRSWRVVPAPGFPTGEETVLVSARPDGSAYLFGAQVSPAGPGPLAEVWHIDGPAGTWRKLGLTQNPSGPISVVADGADAVVTDYLGQVWRVEPDGTVSLLPDAALDGRALGPGRVQSGPGGVLIGLPVDDLREIVVWSTDRGRTWSVESVVS